MPATHHRATSCCRHLPPLNSAFSWILLFAGAIIAEAAIEVSDGPSDPVYPAESPDPWIVADTLTPTGTLTISAGSRVEAGSLALGGRAIIEGAESSLLAGSIDFQGTLVNNVRRADLFVEAGKAEIGSIQERSNTTLFMRAWNSGSILLTGPGGIKSGSTSVISLETGGSYTATGNQSFGGDQSSFSLGPGSGDVSVTNAKARLADAAMSAITGYITSNAGNQPRAGTSQNRSWDRLEDVSGHQTQFTVNGDLQLGGTSSDALIHLSGGSKFEVTGSLQGLEEGSIFNTVSIDSDLIVGGDLQGINGSNSSITVFLGNSMVTVGGNWIPVNGTTSTSTFTALQSQVIAGGDFLIPLGNGSAIETTIQDSTVKLGGDYQLGSPEAMDSAISFKVDQSSLDLDGSLILEVSTSSVMSGDLSEADLLIGGDFIFRSGGEGQSTNVLSLSQTSLTTNGSVLLDSRNKGRSSSSISGESLELDIGRDFLIQRSGNNSDSLVFLNGLTGTVGQDWLIDLGARLNGISDCVLVNITLAVGRDIIMTTDTAPERLNTVAAALDLDIGRDFVLGPDFPLTLQSSQLKPAGKALIKGRLLAKEVALNGNLHLEETGNLQLTWTEDDDLTEILTLNGNWHAHPEGRFTTILQANPPAGEFTVMRHTGPAALSLSGVLNVYFADGYQERIEESTAIPLIKSASPVQGAFSNAAIGQRFPTADGRGSFLLEADETGSILFLTAFQRTNPSAPAIRKAAADPANGIVFLEWTPFGNGKHYEIQTRSDLNFGSWSTRVAKTPSFATSAYLSFPVSAESSFIRVIEAKD
jgi:hypothetical protein